MMQWLLVVDETGFVRPVAMLFGLAAYCRTVFIISLDLR